MSEFSRTNAVRVAVPHSISNDFEKMQAITKEVLGRLGCTPCHSGWDLIFTHENEFIANAKGQVTGGIAARAGA